MALLGTLQVRLGLETGVFSKGMARFAKDAKGQTAGISKAFANLVPSKAILAGLGSLATAATAVSFAKMIQGANNLTDTLRDSSIRLGIGIGDLQAFQLAAGNAGIESGKLTDLLGKLNKASGEIKLGAGNEKTVEAFRSIGIGIAEIQRSNPAQLFERVIGGLGGIQDPAARAATAMAIFGRSGQAALTLVADGTGSLKESRKLLDDLGLSLTKINADNVDAANDALGTLGFVATAAKQKLGAELAPAISDLANRFLLAGIRGHDMGKMIESGVAGSALAIEKIITFARALGGNLDVVRLKLAEGLSHVLSAGARVILFFGKDAPDGINKLKQAVEQGVLSMESSFSGFATAVGTSVVGSLNKAIETVDSLVNGASKGISELVGLANKLPGVKLPTFSYSQTSEKIEPFSVDITGNFLGPPKNNLPTFDEAQVNFYKGLQDDFARNGISYAADAAQAAEDASAAWTDLWNLYGQSGVLPDKPVEDLAKNLKDTITSANDLTGALGGSGAGGGGGATGGGVAGALDSIIPKAKVLGDDLKFTGIEVGNVWTSTMGSIGSAIDEFVQTGKLNFKDLGASILQSIASAAIKSAINNIATAFAGATGGGGNSASSSGWVGAILNAVGSFEGGGYTGSGPRSGGMDGRGGRLAMVHPNETVIDHEKVRAGARSRRRADGVNLTVPITLMPGVSKQELAELLPLVKRDIISTIPALISRGGRYAAAYGQ